MMMRLYHVIRVRVNERTGERTDDKASYWTRDPVTHAEGCTILSKITSYRGQNDRLEELAPDVVPANRLLFRFV